MLVTSRTRKRWIIPKGNVGARMLPRRSAEREAFEEAGVLGRIDELPFGSYRQGRSEFGLPAELATVQAYSMEVTNELPAWHEMHERERRWFTLKEALKVVRDPEIRAILRKFARFCGA